MAPFEPLRVKWDVESRGLLSYVFDYAMGKVSIYYLEEGESFGPETDKTVLGSND